MGKETGPSRIPSIDCFRGFTIMLMVVVNYIADMNVVPACLKHAQDVLSQNTGLNMTLMDVGAPAFIFVIGMTYRLSFNKRVEKDGLNKTYWAFATRYLAIIGMGAFITGFAAVVDAAESAGSWGVLQAIGASGLIALIFVRTGTKTRFAIGFAFLLIYQFLLDNFILAQVLASVHGGVMAILSWGGMLLISTAVGDVFIKATGYKFSVAAISAVLLSLGLFLSLFFVASKHRVSISYVFISLGISSLILFLFNAFLILTKMKLEPFQWWGKNPLSLYLIHMLLMGVTIIPGNEHWYTAAPWWSASLQGAGFFAVIFLIAWGLNKKKMYFKI